MKIYLIQGKTKLRFPFNPEMEFTDGNNNTVVNVLGVRGDVNLLGNRQLRGLTLTGTFPKDAKHALQGLQYSNPPPGHKCVLRIMKMLRHNGGLVYFIATGVTRGKMTIESFSHKPTAGGHYAYTIELKQYVKPKLTIKRKNKSKSTVNTSKKISKTSTKRSTKSVKTTTYVVKKGDTLSAIAKKYTGSSNNYLAIAKQNGISNTNKLSIGQKLVIKVDG